MSVSWSCGCAVVLIPEDIYIAGELVVLAVGAFGTDYIIINTRRHKFSFVPCDGSLKWHICKPHRLNMEHSKLTMDLYDTFHSSFVPSVTPGENALGHSRRDSPMYTVYVSEVKSHDPLSFPATNRTYTVP